MSESIREQAKDLAGSMGGEVADIKDAVSEAITNKEARQSAIAEILSSLKSMWSKIVDSGIIGSIISRIQGIISSLTGSGSGDEGTPLLEGGAGGLVSKLGAFVPDNIKDQLPDGITKMLDSNDSIDVAPASGATTTAVATPPV